MANFDGEYLADEMQAFEVKMKTMRERQEADMHGMHVKIEGIRSEIIEMEKKQKEEISVAMQAFEAEVVARRLYHEAPDDIFELFLILLSYQYDDDEWGEGGLNFLRLVSKRCMRVVESVATGLTCTENARTLPVAVITRCNKINHIRCDRHGDRLANLEGCPVGLKSLIISNGSSLESLEPLSACKELETLEIEYAYEISDLSPLSTCTKLKILQLEDSKISDLNPLLNMTQLEELDLSQLLDEDLPLSKGLSPLSHCKKLRKVNLRHNVAIEDLSPLSQCPDLEELSISWLHRINDLSFFEKGFAKLRVLEIDYLLVGDLSPLAKLQNLKDLDCWAIPRTTSLLPLARCRKLENIKCFKDAKDLDVLRERRPDIKICVFRPKLMYP